ncbi:MAG: DMT family transporter [Gemmatimonadota bacterium]|nr:DMT family transporter [Gemmatimonadota bacterium]
MRARLAVWGVVLIWAANFSVIKAALADFQPFAFNALRFPLASITLLLLLLAARRTIRFERRHWPAILGLGVLGHLAYQPFFILGLDNTLAGNSSLILASVPVFVAVLSAVMGHERHAGRTWAAVVLSFAGIGLVVAGGAQAVGFGGSTVVGDLLTLGAAILWSLYTVLSTPLVRRYGALPVTAVTMWIGTVGLVAAGVPSLLGQPWAAVRPAAWAGLAYAGVLGIAVAYLLWYTSVRSVGSTRTAVYSNMVPVGALAIAWATLGERPTWLQLTGAAAILAGVTLARGARPRGRQEIPPEE